ncbi:MAG: prolyl oligopeptidase family serine peptidase [Mycobacteriales bacterium]
MSDNDSDAVSAWFDVPYGAPDDADSRLDVLCPRSAGPALPVVIRVDGCRGWRPGPRSAAMAPFVNPLLTSYGLATVAVSVRTSDRARWPAQLKDMRTALDWLQRNPLNLPIDGTRVGVWGQSAGAHIAAMTSLTDHRVTAVVAISGPSDFLDPAWPEGTTATAVTDLIGGTLPSYRDAFAAASPIRHVHPDAPAFLIVHGTHDEIAPFSQAERLHEALQRGRVPSELITVPGGHHNLLPDPDAPYRRSVWSDTGHRAARFLSERLS